MLIAARSSLVAILLACALGAPARADETSAACPESDRPVILAIGSSTLGSLLGPMLDAALERDGLTSNYYGVPSSGLARPDYHDWLAEGARLVAAHAPDVVVVELGTNDFQPLWETDHWVRRNQPEWEVLYAQRIDALLGAVGGTDKERLVIWMGPYNFEAENAIEQGPVIDRLLRERIAAYVEAGGRAMYVDAWAATTGRKGWPLDKRPLPGYRGTQEIRTPDGIHLKGIAVRKLFADPIIKTVRACAAARSPAAHAE